MPASCEAGIRLHKRRERRVDLRRVVARNRLGLEIFLQTVTAPFAPVAGLLVASERRGALVRYSLQVDVGGADLAADTARGFDGVGRDVPGESVGRVIGDLHRLGLVLGAENG